MNLCGGAFASPILRGIFAILFHTIFARFHLTWTHIVISNPSTKRWYRRIPDRKTALRVLAL